MVRVGTPEGPPWRYAQPRLGVHEGISETAESQPDAQE